MIKEDYKKLLEDTLKLYRNLPHYEPKKAGKLEIREQSTEPYKPVTLVGTRQAFLEGRKAAEVVLTDGYKFHVLYERGAVWMSTTLQELAQLVPVHREATGRVLIGGLGMGAIAHLISQKFNVRHVTVVEKNLHIINFIKPFLDPGIRYVNQDLFEYLKEYKGVPYTYGFFDIWARTGEEVWMNCVVPLRRLAYNKVRRVDCWQETEMQGQVIPAVTRAATVDSRIYVGKSQRHYWVFRKFMEARFPARITSEEVIEGISDPDKLKLIMEIDKENGENEEIKRISNIYVNRIGSIAWEEMFGSLWDSTLDKRLKKNLK